MKLFFILIIPSLILALPENEKIVHGQAEHKREGQNLKVIVSSDKAIINYKSFNIGEKEAVIFEQPGATSTVLSRVVGTDPSRIMGQLRANGKFFLINPNGVIFGAKSQVNVGSLIASTLDIGDKDFIDGNYRFTLNPKAKNSYIVNQGHINSEATVALIAPHIQAGGTILARAESVALIAGQIVTLDFTGDGLIKFSVQGGLESSIIEHLGKISAPKGEVLLHLKAIDQLISSIINVEGLIEGNNIIKQNGVVRIAHQSQIEARKVEVLGYDIETLGQVSGSDKVSLKAVDSTCYRGGKLTGNVSLGGRLVMISRDLEVNELQIPASEHVFLGGNITVSKGPLVFNSSVSITNSHVQLNANGICFNKYLEASSHLENVDLTLSSQAGNITFGGFVGQKEAPLGLLTIRDVANVEFREDVFAKGILQKSGIGVTTFHKAVDIRGKRGLELHNQVINLNKTVKVSAGNMLLDSSGGTTIGLQAEVSVAGSFIHEKEGKLRCGGRIQSGEDMHFKAPVELTDHVSLTAGDGNKEISFYNTVDGTGGLSIVSGDLQFKGDIGRQSPLSSLIIKSSGSITLANIGGEKTGVTGPIDFEANQSIYFQGARVQGGTQSYSAQKEFRMQAHQVTSFRSPYSNSPIFFKIGEVILEEGSDLSISTESGEIMVRSLSAEKIQNFFASANEGDVTVGRFKGEVNNFSITAGTISILEPIQAGRITLRPKKEIRVNGNIHTTESHLTFDGPVIVNHPDVEFTTKQHGDIIFMSSLDGSGKLGLHAPGQVIRFNGPVGNTKRFAMLTANSDIIDQNGPLRVTGPITFTGEIHLGANINTTGNNINFNGPVILDNTDTISLNTGYGHGDINFESTLNADSIERGLFLKTAEGAIRFKGAVGSKGALGHLNLNAKYIELNEVGGKHVGVEGLLNAIAKQEVELKGKILYAREQTWEAPKYTILAKDEAHIISEGQRLAFEQGAIHLGDGTHLTVESRGGRMEIFEISAQSFENVTLNGGNGEVYVGTMVDHVGHLDVLGRTIHLTSEIYGQSVVMEARENIFQSSNKAKIITTGNLGLNAQHGSVGDPDNPVWVKAGGRLTVGAHHLAILKGDSSDGTVYHLASNPPDQLFFNGFEYFNMTLSPFLDDEQGIITIAPDLYTNGGADKVTPNAVTRRRAPLYYSE